MYAVIYLSLLLISFCHLCDTSVSLSLDLLDPIYSQEQPLKSSPRQFSIAESCQSHLSGHPGQNTAASSPFLAEAVKIIQYRIKQTTALKEHFVCLIVCLFDCLF